MSETKPVDMILLCPRCHEQHIDRPEPEINWLNPPHKSHLCLYCGTVWRPADIPTNGVARINTHGKNDNWNNRSCGWRRYQIANVEH